MDYPDSWFYRIIMDKNPNHINWDYYHLRRALIPSGCSNRLAYHYYQNYLRSTKERINLMRYDFLDAHLNQKV